MFRITLLVLAFTLGMIASGWTQTPIPTLQTPSSGAMIPDVSGVFFHLPVAAKSGTVKLTFSGSSTFVLTVADAESGAGDQILILKLSNPTLYSQYIAAGSPIADGTYTVTLSYQDAGGDPAASSAPATGVVTEMAAMNPTLAAPIQYSVSKSPINVDFTLPEAAQAGSVKLSFYDESYTATTLVLSATEETVGRHTFSFNPANPTASPEIASGGPLADGVYQIVDFNYVDLFGNSGDAQFNSSQFQNAFTVDTVTQTPTLTKPTAGALSLNPMTVDFTLPEAALAGSVMLTCSNGTITRELTLASGTAGHHTFNFDPANPTASPEITSGSSIPDGTYTVTLSYQDALGNAAGTAALTGVVIDTTKPVITVPPATRSVFAGQLGDYTGLAQVTDAHPSGMVTQDPPVGTTTTPGILSVTLTTGDGAGNYSSVNFDLDVRPLTAVSTTLLAESGTAPGVGTVGLPAGATLLSFGTPAVDGSGNIAYLAKWKSGSVKGSGLFLNNNTCLGIVTGSAPGIAGAIFGSFTDPVIDSGVVACVATLKGTPKPPASVVESTLLSGTGLEPIARAGDIAPDLSGTQPVGGAVFKKFKGVAVDGTSIAIFAQLSGGTGAQKSTGANDLGLWIKDGASPLTLALREGEMVGGKTIKTLVSFGAGAGSPGQGRGWLTQTGSGSLVQALATFTDKSQAVLQASASGSPVMVLSETGTGGAGGPSLPGTGFASYGMPTVNGTGDSVFLAKLLVSGTAVTKANAMGIFAALNGSSSYAPIARLTGTAGGTGAVFSLLKDPVLAADGGVAFLATLKGGGLKAPAATTIWWMPPGGALELIAQGGAQPGDDLPTGAQWSNFTSLAIAANRGPIFAGTMVTGKGGVKAGTNSAVWCTDFTGALRLLFRTGDTIGGKSVSSFTLLNATNGSLGVTRSFNNAERVVWIATFTDKTQAIVTTEVP